jgi:hypothetical protein
MTGLAGRDADVDVIMESVVRLGRELLTCGAAPSRTGGSRLAVLCREVGDTGG